MEKCVELTIPVPWGHVAAKAWGDEEHPIVLVFHGLADNAGSFDRLVPKLPQSFRYICCDLPGHGKSGHFPPFFPVYITNYMIVCKILTQHFGQERYIFMAHSFGAQIAFMFAQVYPEHVEKLIMLDAVHAFPVPARIFKTRLRGHFDWIINLEEKMRTRQQPQYTYEETLEKVLNQRWTGSLSKEAAEQILKRGIAPGDEEGKVKFTLDQRIKTVFSPVHDMKYILETLKHCPVTCPVLILLGTGSEKQHLVMAPVIKVLKKSRNVFIKYVDGYHDVHNDNPEVVVPYIARFLLGADKGKKYVAKL